MTSMWNGPTAHTAKRAINRRSILRIGGLILVVLGSGAEFINLILTPISFTPISYDVRLERIGGLIFGGVVFVLAPIAFAVVSYMGYRWGWWPLAALCIVAILIECLSLIFAPQLRILTLVFTVALSMGTVALGVSHKKRNRSA